MSFLLDPLALLLIGYLAAKINYFTLIFDDHVQSRGHLRRNLLLVGAAVTSIFVLYSSILYLDVIFFPWPLPKWFDGTTWMLDSGLPLGISRSYATDIAASVIFLSYPFCYYLGTKLGLTSKVGENQRNRERDRIVTHLVRAAFPRGGAIPPSGEDVNAAKGAISLFSLLPPEYAETLTVLLFVFNSRLTVFFFTRKWKKFVDLDGDSESTREKRKYLEAWGSNVFLLSALKFLELILAYGYYTNEMVWKYINYSGPLIPNDPPWMARVSSSAEHPQ
jgi:hypothetical protein